MWPAMPCRHALAQEARPGPSREARATTLAPPKGGTIRTQQHAMAGVRKKDEVDSGMAGN